MSRPMPIVDERRDHKRSRRLSWPALLPVVPVVVAPAAPWFRTAQFTIGRVTWTVFTQRELPFALLKFYVAPGRDELEVS